MNDARSASRTKDSVVVIRLWMEHHDPRPRARLLAGTLPAEEPGDPGPAVIGREQILEAVAARIREFEEQGE